MTAVASPGRVGWLYSSHAGPTAARPVTRSRPARFAAPLAIILITVGVFAPSVWNGFVDRDDPVYILDNTSYRGLGWPQLRWMLTATVEAHWHPLTWLSLGLDYVMWGMKPAGYHASSVLLHALTAAAF